MINSIAYTEHLYDKEKLPEISHIIETLKDLPFSSRIYIQRVAKDSYTVTIEFTLLSRVIYFFMFYLDNGVLSTSDFMEDVARTTHTEDSLMDKIVKSLEEFSSDLLERMGKTHNKIIDISRRYNE